MIEILNESHKLFTSTVLFISEKEYKSEFDQSVPEIFENHVS